MPKTPRTLIWPHFQTSGRDQEPTMQTARCLEIWPNVYLPTSKLKLNRTLKNKIFKIYRLIEIIDITSNTSWVMVSFLQRLYDIFIFFICLMESTWGHDMEIFRKIRFWIFFHLRKRKISRLVYSKQRVGGGGGGGGAEPGLVKLWLKN